MGRISRWQVLLVLPFLGLIYGPLYATHNFYAFEGGCVLLAAALSWFVYRPEPVSRRPTEQRRPAKPLHVTPVVEEEPRFTRDPSQVRRRVTRAG